ncbi:MAG TPA: iron transporter FeoB, partial [Syntrophomonas wolfei]|nr:iron transporter FeoB [Syntrophomonas wolfei]
LATLAVVAIIMTGIATTLLVSSLLSRTLFRGMPSFFVLELPPFRRPQLGQILIRSLLDRTLFVLWRAV